MTDFYTICTEPKCGNAGATWKGKCTEHGGAKILTGGLHNSWSPPGTKCPHGKRLNACSECYKQKLKKGGFST